MKNARPFRYRRSQVYGWPFYIARKGLRYGADRMRAAADALSGREQYPFPLFLRPLLPDNAKLKNAHRGQRCFVIGNGPSLAQQKIEALAGEITYVMNGFVNHPLIDQIRPTYYCLSDPIFFDQSASSESFLDRLFRTATSSRLIVPYAGANQVARAGEDVEARTSYITFAGNLATASLRRIDLTRPIPNIMNCAQLAILSALYAGCSPIYLLGMDHDWLAHRSHDRHFYSGRTLQNHPDAHGDCGKYAYRQILEDVLKVWRGYQTLRRYAEANDQQIVNCTAGGFLDVFERADFGDVVRRAV